MDPLWMMVKELGGDAALDKLESMIKTDESMVPELTSHPDDWVDQFAIAQLARQEDEDSRSGEMLQPLRDWLAAVGEGSWEAGFDVLCERLRQLSSPTPESAVLETSQLLGFSPDLHLALLVVYHRYMGPDAVRLNAQVAGGLGMKGQTHMPGAFSIWDDLRGFKELKVTFRQLFSLVDLTVAVSYPFDVDAIKYICANDRREQVKCLLLSYDDACGAAPGALRPRLPLALS